MKIGGGWAKVCPIYAGRHVDGAGVERPGARRGAADACRPVWQGEWRDGDGSGGFRLVLGAPGVRAGGFRGTYTSADGGEELAWNGVREMEGETPDVPCTFAG